MGFDEMIAKDFIQDFIAEDVADLEAILDDGSRDVTWVLRRAWEMGAHAGYHEGFIDGSEANAQVQ